MSTFREGTGIRWILSGAAGVLVLVGLILAAVMALSLGQPSPALATDTKTDAKQTAGPLSVSPDDICKEGITGEWHFVINRVDEQVKAPTSIQVTFNDGHTYTVDLDSGTGSPTAHYTFTTHLTNTLLEATAEIYHEWKGNFVVSHTPCVPTLTLTSTPTPTPTPPTPTVLAATPAPTPPPTAVLPVELPPTGGGPVGGENSFVSLALLLVAAALMLGGSTMAVALSRKRPS